MANRVSTGSRWFLCGDTVIKLQLADRLAPERGKNPALPFESEAQGLELLLEKIDTDATLSVLDLGAPSQTVVDMLYGMRVRLHIGDLFGGLGWSFSDPDSPRPRANIKAIEESLSHVASQRFDAIFCWDLLNYLSVNELPTLLKHLRGLSHAGTLFHCFLFDSDEMPRCPSRLLPTRRRRLRYEPVSETLVETPGHYEKLVAKHLSGFSMAHQTHFGSILNEQLLSKQSGKSQVA